MFSDELICENLKRNEVLDDVGFNPLTGFNSTGVRQDVLIEDYSIPSMSLPVRMLNERMMQEILKYGNLKDYILAKNLGDYDVVLPRLSEAIIRLRIKYDYPFWAYFTNRIKNKAGGDYIPFRLNSPQRTILIPEVERCIANNLPIRICMLKSRQWGGSTSIESVIAYHQLVLTHGVNSIIAAHVKVASVEIEDMYRTLIENYPRELLYKQGNCRKKEPVYVSVGGQPGLHRVPQRNCKVRIGTAEKPDSIRSGDASLAHLSEVGLWKRTDGKSPDEMVSSALGGMLYLPLTLVVYESTAKGTGTFFHQEWTASAAGRSMFTPMFVPWFRIGQYRIGFNSDEERNAFADFLFANKENTQSASDREESGAYLWRLWTLGASLEGINWYVQTRKAFHEHAFMATEYPSDDIEAFVHSGKMEFDRYQVESFRYQCKKPTYIGEMSAEGTKGEESLKDLRFDENSQGKLWIWDMPQLEDDIIITDRYCVVVDIGGRSEKADWSVIVVFDRYWMTMGEGPVVVAQWYGHTDMDILAWKAVQIAKFYNDALLVIESNTLETKDRDRYVDSDQSFFILEEIKMYYDNLYARKQRHDEIKEKAPIRYGFHTNVSTKPMLIATLHSVLRDGGYVERDERVLNEYCQYERKKNGAYGAIQGCHDDLLMTRAIGLRICIYEMSLPQIIQKKKTESTEDAVSYSAGYADI